MNQCCSQNYVLLNSHTPCYPEHGCLLLCIVCRYLCRINSWELDWIKKQTVVLTRTKRWIRCDFFYELFHRLILFNDRGCGLTLDFLLGLPKMPGNMDIAICSKELPNEILTILLLQCGIQNELFRFIKENQ